MDPNRPNRMPPARLGETAADVHRRWRDWHNAEADRFTALAEREPAHDPWHALYLGLAYDNRQKAWACQHEINLIEEAREAA